MAERWPERGVIGIDLAAPFIAYARSRVVGDRPVFEVSDACALPYQDGRFAGVAAHLVFLSSRSRKSPCARCGASYHALRSDSRGGLVFQRMLWDKAVAIDPNARVARDSLFANPVAIPGGFGIFPTGRACGSRGAIPHHSHGLREFRGVLAAVPGSSPVGCGSALRLRA